MRHVLPVAIVPLLAIACGSVVGVVWSFLWGGNWVRAALAMYPFACFVAICSGFPLVERRLSALRALLSLVVFALLLAAAQPFI